jgi:GNAT superfamily N-acetyltransferase
MSTASFDQCTPDVQDRIAHIFLQNWSTEIDAFNADDCLAYLRRTFDSRPNLLFVREDGLATVSVDMKNFTGCSPMIGNIYTAPNKRGLGYGTAMLAYAEIYLAKAGFIVAYLWCYTDLEAFYKARGWYKIQDQEVAGKPAVIMAKNLGGA